MKKLLKIYLTVILAVVLPASVIAEDDISVGSSGGQFIKVGAAGAQFLKIGVGARANAMGGAFSAVSDDLSSLHWNPAGIAEMKSMAALVSYTQWFADYSHNFAAMSMPIGEAFAAGISLVQFGTDKIEYTTIDYPDGTGIYYSVEDLALNATFGGFLTDEFSFGVTAKYISSTIANLSASGFAFDIGTKYETGIQGITLGFSIHNLGPEMSFSGQDLRSSKKLWEAIYAAPIEVEMTSYPLELPLIFRAGMAADVYNEDVHKVIAAVDFVTYSDIAEQFAFGAEYTWNEILNVRAGYVLGHDQLGFSGGLGFSYIGGGFGGQIDYSITPTFDLGLVNRITVGVNVD